MSLRAVVDTCVLIDAVFNGDRSCRDILRQAGRTYRVVLSEDILTEYLLIIMRFGLQGRIGDQAILRAARAIARLLEGSGCVSPKQYNMCKSDPDDNKFVDCAIDGDADYIVTNDTHLTSIPGPIISCSGKTVQVVSAWQFYQTLRTSGITGRRGG